MRDTIDMARKVYGAHTEWTGAPLDRLEQLVALVRADEREEFQRWFDAVTAQHKQEILAEREACAMVCESEAEMFKSCAYGADDDRYEWKEYGARDCATAIRNRGSI
jgi:predicted ArsR family transcriptional regulator